MKVQLTKQLLDAIIAAYNKVNTPIEASDIDFGCSIYQSK